MTLVYRSQSKCTFKNSFPDDRIVQLYQKAFESAPWNEEFGNQWFMALVRMQDFKSCQQASLKLSKQFKSNPKYGLWTIMSLVLQVSLNVPNSSLLLTLAQKMMDKAVQDEKLLGFEGAFFLLKCS